MIRSHKYNAAKTHFSGIWFASKLEAAVYGILLLRKRAGEIAEIKCQDHVRFHTHAHGNVIMIPDFRCTTPSGEVFWVEAKGLPTNSFLRKKKAWKVGGPAKMEIWGGSWKNPQLMEIITPAEKTSAPTSEGS